MKLSAYECGNDPVRLPRGEKFSVKFYVVAMLFIIFDIEIIFLFPWAVRFRQLGLFGLVEMAFFIGLVFVAYVYIWRTGGFDWARTSRPPRPRCLATSWRGRGRSRSVDARPGGRRCPLSAWKVCTSGRPRGDRGRGPPRRAADLPRPRGRVGAKQSMWPARSAWRAARSR